MGYRRHKRRKPFLRPDNRAAIIAQGIVYLREEYPTKSDRVLACVCASRLAIEAGEVLAVIERVQT